MRKNEKVKVGENRVLDVRHYNVGYLLALNFINPFQLGSDTKNAPEQILRFTCLRFLMSS